MVDEEDTVLLSFSFSENRDWVAGTSGASGKSGISKDTAEQNKKKILFGWCFPFTALAQFIDEV